MTPFERLETAQAAYVRAFRAMPPEPVGVDLARLAQELEHAVAVGRPIADDFDWWAHLPPGAFA